jgi:guanylate kinase
MIKNGEMLEYAEYVGNYYGTPLEYVNETLDAGRDVFLEIEVQGALQVKEKAPDGVYIFLTPPDLIELRERITNRGTDSEEVIDERMKKAHEEIEMMQLYDYAVVNDEVEQAVERVLKIIDSEHCRVERVIGKYRKMLATLD